MYSGLWCQSTGFILVFFVLFFNFKHLFIYLWLHHLVCGIFSPLTRDRTWALGSESMVHGVLNAGSPGNSLILMFKSFTSFCITQPFSSSLGSGTLVHINF